MPNMRGSRVLLFSILMSACGGSNGRAPTTPTQAATVASSPLSPAASLQSLVLDQPLDVTLNAKVVLPGVNCEIGNDPVPCVRFAIDTPRAGTLLVRMQFPA